MKKYCILALALVLTAALLMGCGCTNQNMEDTSAPTVLPTNEEIWNTTEATTRATTEATMPSATNSGTIGEDNGNGSGNNGNSGTGGNSNDDTGSNGNGGTGGNGTQNDNTTTSTEGGMESRARRMMPGSN